MVACALLSIKQYIPANIFDKKKQLIDRVESSKMLGISRQTLTGWIKKGFITPQKSKYLTNTETFNTDAVLRKFQDY